MVSVDLSVDLIVRLTATAGPHEPGLGVGHATVEIRGQNPHLDVLFWEIFHLPAFRAHDVVMAIRADVPMNLAIRAAQRADHGQLGKEREVVVDGGQTGAAAATHRASNLRCGRMDAMPQKVSKKGAALHGDKLVRAAKLLLEVLKLLAFRLGVLGGHRVS